MNLKGGVIMKVLKWILLVWTVLGIPYIEDFYGLLYLVLVIGVIGKGLYDEEKHAKEQSRQTVESTNKK